MREAERTAAGAAAKEIRRWDGSRQLRPRFPAVEMCAGALGDALARGATFVMRSGVVDCSGQHPSGFLLQSHWNRVAFGRCRAETALLRPQSGRYQIGWYAKTKTVLTPTWQGGAPSRRNRPTKREREKSREQQRALVPPPSASSSRPSSSSHTMPSVTSALSAGGVYF